MAKFTGSGSMTISGSNPRVYDCEFIGATRLIIDGFDAVVARSKFVGSGNGITVNSGRGTTLIEGNYINPSLVGIDVLGNDDGLSIIDNHIGANANVGIDVAGSSHTKHIYANNIIESDIPIHIDGATIDDLVIDGNSMVPSTYGIHVNTGGASFGKISNNTIRGGTTSIFVDNASNLAISDNFCDEPSQHGIIIDGMVDGSIVDNVVYRPGASANNTYDGIRIVTGDDLLIMGNKVAPLLAGNLTRYGINIVAGNNNAVYANYLGNPTLYGTADSFDGGTGTIVSAIGGAIGGQLVEGEGLIGTGFGGAAPISFSQAGALTVGTGTFKMPFPVDMTIESVICAVGDAPTGADLIIDVNKNGTTIFSSNPKPEVSDGNVVGANATPNVTTLAPGDYLSIDIDQIGSTNPGEDLTVTILVREG